MMSKISFCPGSYECLHSQNLSDSPLLWLDPIHAFFAQRVCCCWAALNHSPLPLWPRERQTQTGNQTQAVHVECSPWLQAGLAVGLLLCPPQAWEEGTLALVSTDSWAGVVLSCCLFSSICRSLKRGESSARSVSCVCKTWFLTLEQSMVWSAGVGISCSSFHGKVLRPFALQILRQILSCVSRRSTN